MSETLREAVGAFHNPDRLQAAIDELQSSGFNHHDISLLASQKAIEDKLDHVYVRSDAIENEPDATHENYRLPEDRWNAEGVMIGVPLYIAAPGPRSPPSVDRRK